MVVNACRVSSMMPPGTMSLSRRRVGRRRIPDQPPKGLRCRVLGVGELARGLVHVGPPGDFSPAPHSGRTNSAGIEVWYGVAPGGSGVVVAVIRCARAAAQHTAEVGSTKKPCAASSVRAARVCWSVTEMMLRAAAPRRRSLAGAFDQPVVLVAGGPTRSNPCRYVRTAVLAAEHPFAHAAP